MSGFAALVSAYVLSQFFRSFLAVLAPVLDRELGVDAGELAVASGAWFAMFALMQFPVGASLDRFGPRRTAAYLLALAGGGGAALFAISQNAVHISLAMALIGAGCSPVLMATLYLFARNHAPARFATLSSTFIAVGTLGNIVSAEPLSAAVAAIGWRASGWALCAITIAAAILILVTVRDPERPAVRIAGQNGSYVALLRIAGLWLVFPCILLGYAVAAGIRGLWVGPYLAEVHGLGDLEVGRATLYMAIALALGSLFYGPLDRLFDSRKKVNLAGNLVVLLAVLWLAASSPQSVPLIVFAMVLIGFFGAGYAVQVAHGMSFVPAHMAGRGVTLMNFFAIGGAGLMQFLTGRIYETFQDPALPAAPFTAVFWLYAITLGIALAVYSFSRDAKPSLS